MTKVLILTDVAPKENKAPESTDSVLWWGLFTFLALRVKQLLSDDAIMQESCVFNWDTNTVHSIKHQTWWSKHNSTQTDRNGDV